jgi:deoxyribonuclease IV
MLLIGSHVSLGGSKQFLGSVEETLRYGANCFMVYTGAPQNTLRKPIEQMRISEALQLMKAHDIDQNHVIVHAPYIVNLANPDPIKQQFAVDFLSEEVRRTEALGARILVLHPGAHMESGVSVGIDNIASGVRKMIANTPTSNVIIALEGMAGKGTEVGRDFNELAQLIKAIDNEDRIGVCFDTCHTHDAGYDVKEHFEDVLGEFDRIVGLKYIRVVHVNDSKNIRGAHKDRHENFGFGEIGFSTLHYAVHHPLLAHVPKILETPYISDPSDERLSYPPYKYEIEMIQNGQFDADLKTKIIATRGE